MTPVSAHMEAGTVFGGYRIDGVAGEGGMGVVYRATQLALDRSVALKVIASGYAHDASFRDRFNAEALLAASIDHPNVVPVFEAGESDGVLFLVMRYVDGIDLRALVDSAGALEPSRAVRIVCQVAAALDAAHRRGLVHRDVKPPNVLITQVGEEHAYLTDFGLTKHAAAAGGFTHTGQFVGTPDFVSPEQIRGEPADARADVYALGCVLFYVLTGRTPFPRESELGKLYAHLGDPVPPASDFAPAVPPALDQVIATAMAKEPEERYASAGDLARAANAALHGELAPPPAGSVAIGDAAAAPEPAAQSHAAPNHAAQSVAAQSNVAQGHAAPSHAAQSHAAPSHAAQSHAGPNNAAPSASAHSGALHSGAAHSAAAAAAPRAAGPAGWPRGRRVALLVARPTLLVAAVAVAVLGAAGALGGGDDDGPPDRTAPPPATADTPRVVATIDVGDGPDGVTVDGNNVFVSHARDGTLIRISARSNKVKGDPVPVGASPDQIAAGKGTVWVVDSSGDQLQRLQSDPTLQATATIPVGTDAQAISLGPQLVWVANTGDDTVQRVDRAAAQLVGDPIGVGDHPLGIFVGSKVWVTNFRDGTLSKIDIATAQVEGNPVKVGAGARGVTEGMGSVWVSNLKDGTVARVDSGSGQILATIKVGKRPKDIVTKDGFVWVVNSGSNTVSRIDPKTNRLAGAAIPVGRNPIGLAAGKRSLWVTNFADDTVSRIDP
ncbi:MAG TPA: protein kinase [Solirubrobacteraceae bacterium]|nr:protein kinase [Solirubrobacteraceae bacterium]